MNVINLLLQSPGSIHFGENKELETHHVDIQRFPTLLVWSIVVICIAPFTFNLIGIDFSSSSRAFDVVTATGMEKHQLMDSMFYRL